MSMERRVSLFRNGRNQAVRIPKEMALPGTEAILRKEGDRLILEPAHPATLLGLLATLEPIEEAFPAVEDPVPDDVAL